jgi:hypothetical protein
MLEYQVEPEPDEPDEEAEGILCWSDFIRILEGLDVFFIDKLLYKEYVEMKLIKPYSVRKLAEEFELSENTLRNKFIKIKEKIKEKHNDENEGRNG